jgi:hypothetical protein
MKTELRHRQYPGRKWSHCRIAPVHLIVLEYLSILNADAGGMTAF